MGRLEQLETVARLAKVGPLTVHYEVTGEGPPLVLVHGLSGSGRWWAYNVPSLAKHFRVYNVDLVGFGRSRGQRLVLQEAAGWLAEWLQMTGITQAHLVGHSMGRVHCGGPHVKCSAPISRIGWMPCRRRRW